VGGRCGGGKALCGRASSGKIRGLLSQGEAFEKEKSRKKKKICRLCKDERPEERFGILWRAKGDRLLRQEKAARRGLSEKILRGIFQKCKAINAVWGGQKLGAAMGMFITTNGGL